MVLCHDTPLQVKTITGRDAVFKDKFKVVNHTTLMRNSYTIPAITSHGSNGSCPSQENAVLSEGKFGGIVIFQHHMNCHLSFECPLRHILLWAKTLPTFFSRSFPAICLQMLSLNFLKRPRRSNTSSRDSHEKPCSVQFEQPVSLSEFCRSQQPRCCPNQIETSQRSGN